jgi:hypothetical protein
MERSDIGVFSAMRASSPHRASLSKILAFSQGARSAGNLALFLIVFLVAPPDSGASLWKTDAAAP